MLFGKRQVLPLRKERMEKKANKREPLRAQAAKRASPSLRAGITIEAAFVLPLFIFFAAQILYIFDMIRLQSRFLMALHETGTMMAEYAFYTEYAFSGLLTDESQTDDDADTSIMSSLNDLLENETGLSSLAGYGVSLVLSQTYVKNAVTEYLGQEYMDNTCLSGGADSVSYLRSQIMVSDDVIELVADYRISPFLSIFDPEGFSVQTRYYGHAWTGYTIGDAEDESGDDEEQIVYITPTGSVYHLTDTCTYLKPSIILIDASEVDSARNSSGGRYYACETCEPSKTGTLVITEDGNRYHRSSSCSALKRTVIQVALSEVEGSMNCCSKCGSGQ